MTKPLIAAAALLALRLGAAQVPRLAHAKSCQDSFGNNACRCMFKAEGDALEICVQAISPGSGGKFDLAVGEGIATLLQCMCEATGGFEKPKFDDANERFLCGNSEFGDAARGKIEGNGGKITKGQYLFNDDLDTSFVFECRLDPTCGP